jgi:hypothetical protein
MRLEELAPLYRFMLTQFFSHAGNGCLAFLVCGFLTEEIAMRAQHLQHLLFSPTNSSFWFLKTQ